MSRMVTARVPDALYEQGALQLEKIGATTSELVKAAFEYVLKEHSLPKKQASSSKDRTLSKERAQELAKAFQACTLELNIPSDIDYDKQTIREARSARYEALA